MIKLAISLYGIFAYLIGLAGVLAFALFMGSWDFLPIHINSGLANSTTTQAILVNLLILLLFGLHHSIAARSSFKEKLTRIMPAAIERSTYVIISGLFMFAICLYWQPLAGTVWMTENIITVGILKAVHLLGWLTLVAATFEIDHFHLMGLKQSLVIDIADNSKLKEGFFYRMVRHPIQTGLLMGVWSTAHMSTTQFMLSASLTLYIFIGLHFEEKSLIARYGDLYLDYKTRVPSIIPFWPTKWPKLILNKKMKIAAQRKGSWFLFTTNDNLLLNVNCNHGFFGYSWMIELNEAEKQKYKVEGDTYLDLLAEAIQNSNPIHKNTTSPFVDRNVSKKYKNESMDALKKYRKNNL